MDTNAQCKGYVPIIADMHDKLEDATSLWLQAAPAAALYSPLSSNGI